jgi:catechol 2,3-dioxygenase-like lactoylglutathione lyase family enzyme
MKLKLAVVTLWAEDVQKMTDFYQNILGLPLITMHHGRPHFDFGGGYLTVLQGKPYKIQESMESRFPILAFAVEDVHKFIHQLEKHNIEMPWGVETDSDSSWVMFYDPAGNLIEVARMDLKNHNANG